ncbi:MAG TPA: glutathione S-transferase C-terminal domain-containing protein [Streptosporangiaceae bacterium]|jgi:putative glutathione S-transferase
MPESTYPPLGTPAGRYRREPGWFSERVTADGTSSFPVQPGRYHLYASTVDPWAHRALIVRRLLGLEETIGLTVTDPIRDERGWRFTTGPDGRDPATGAHYLAELYEMTDPAYAGGITVPCVWDRATRRIVSNDFTQITLMMETEFRTYHRHGAPDLYPVELRQQIDAVNTLVHLHVNEGVYRAGMATTQGAYDTAFDAVFTTLDALEEKLTRHRYLVGDRLTEADIRLYPTLFRFDAVYYPLFRCNLRRLVDYPNLWGYARDLYQRTGFHDTSDMDDVKRHFYQTMDALNPSRIVPKGPYSEWHAPHFRDRLPSRA